jgi:hypothetical protein
MSASTWPLIKFCGVVKQSQSFRFVQVDYGNASKRGGESINVEYSLVSAIFLRRWRHESAIVLLSAQYQRLSMPCGKLTRHPTDQHQAQ